MKLTDEMVQRAAETYGEFIARDNGWHTYDGWLEATKDWRAEMARAMLTTALAEPQQPGERQ